MANGMIFHARHRNTLLCHAGGAVKLIMLILLSIFLSIGSPLFVFSLFLFLILIALIDRLPASIIFKDGLFFIILAFFILVTEYFATKDYIQSLCATSRFLSIVLASLIFTDTTSPDDVARGLGGLLSPIIGKAAYRLASIVELTIAMLPVITDTLVEINESRKARLGHFFPHPVKAISSFSISVLTKLFSYVDEYSDALASRLYDSSAKRYTPPFNKADAVIVLFIILLTSVFIWTK